MSATGQRQKIKELHLIRHVANGESRTLAFEKLDPANVPRSLIEIDEFEYSDRTVENTRLPDGVTYELRISEQVLAASDFSGMSSIKHGDLRFRNVSPSPFPPAGMERYWRFWLAPAEDEE